MATPHVAGSAAILKQLHPTWSPEQIKSALVTTGDPVKSFRTGLPLTNPMVRGGGRIDLANAGFVPATVEADPGQASIDFGLFPAQSFSVSEPVTITDTSGVGFTYTISVAPVQSTGPVVSAPTSITVGPGGTSSFTATLTATPSNVDGDYFGYIVLSGGSATLSIPYWVELSSSPHAGSAGVHAL
jgi:hypothetical protein